MTIATFEQQEIKMEKVWLKSYPPGVPATIHYDNFSSLVDFYEHQCEKFADHIVCENFGKQLTYRELNEQSKLFAAYLQKKCELKKGTRVAIMLPNVLQFPIAMMGILRAGMVVVNVNPLYTSHELVHQLKDAGCKAIIVLENFAKELQHALPQTDIEHVIVTKMGDSLGWRGGIMNFVVKHIKNMVPRWKIKNVHRYKSSMKQAKKMVFDSMLIHANDIAFLQYTGGTTGLAKGAILTHRNMLANIHQCITWVKSGLTPGKDTVLTALPLYHIFSLTVCCFCFMAVGSKCLLITNPRDIKSFVRTLMRNPVSVFVGVNTLFNALLHNEKFKSLDFSAMKMTISGGMALQKAVADKWQQTTGVNITEGYGLTEASPVVTINPLTEKHFNGSIGLPVPATDICLRNDAGEDVALGKVGELCVRGPQVMRGYWQKPTETALVLDEDGWLRTGDMARMDERGFVYVVDRKKDMIVVSGFNVYPNEIEDVIAAHPGVKEVAVIGVASERTGEAVKAVIVPEHSGVTQDEILHYCRERLTAYKVPKIIEFRDDLPKSNVGKVLRRELRD